MIRILPVLGLAVLAVALVAADGERLVDDGTTRYLLTVVRQDAGTTGEGTPLNLTGLGKPVAPVGATAPNLAADGFVAAVPHSTKILEAIRARGAADVLCRGECEVRTGMKGFWITGTRVPFTTASYRGNQPTVSVTYEEIGTKLEVSRMFASDLVSARIEFTAIGKVCPGLGGIVDKHSAEGTILLPDGFTAIFTYQGRVPADVMNQVAPEYRTDAKPSEDLVTQYFVLLTRMDVAAPK